MRTGKKEIDVSYVSSSKPSHRLTSSNLWEIVKDALKTSLNKVQNYGTESMSYFSVLLTYSDSWKCDILLISQVNISEHFNKLNDNKCNLESNSWVKIVKTGFI